MLAARLAQQPIVLRRGHYTPDSGLFRSHPYLSSLTNRPLHSPSNQTLSIKLLGKENKINLTLDGQEIEIGHHQSIKITKCKNRIFH